jgi:hypothetical protein
MDQYDHQANAHTATAGCVQAAVRGDSEMDMASLRERLMRDDTKPVRVVSTNGQSTAIWLN